MLKKRLVTAAFLVAMAFFLLYFGRLVLATGALACLTFALYEEYRALGKAGHRPVSWPTWLATILCIPLAAIFGHKVVVPILMAASLLTIVCVLFRKDPQLEDALMSLLPLFSILLPGLSVLSLALIEPLSVQRTLFALLVAVPVLGDSMAFLVGSRMKGPKFCPEVSPNKTISGAVGGLIGSLFGAMAIGLIARLMCAPTTWPMLPTWWQYLLIGLIGGAAAQMGDLFASLVKRHCGIKDFSNLFPGHGGMLDRLDSILFMAIVVLCFRLITG